MASTVIGKLTTVLTVSTGPFSKGMARAKSQTAGFVKGIERMNKRLLSFKGLLVGALATAGLVRLAKSAFATIDATAKLAAQIGSTTEEISKLRFAAEQTGGTAALLDNSLAIMAKRLGEAAGGSGEAKRGLDLLGLSAEKLAKMKAHEAFALIAEKMSKLEDPATKAAAASFLFSRQGIKLVNMLDLGAAGLQKFGNQLERMGGLIDSEGAAKVEAMRDSLNRLKLTIFGVIQTLSLKLAPVIEDVSERVQGFVVFVRDLSDSTKGLVAMLAKWTVGLLGIALVLPRVIGLVKALVFAVKGATTALIFLTSLSGPAGIAALAVGIIAAGTATAHLSVAWNGVKQDMANATSAVESARMATDKLADSMGNVAEQSARALANTAGLVKEQTRTIHDLLNRALAPFGGDIGAARESIFDVLKSSDPATQIRDLQRSIKQARALASVGAISPEQFDIFSGIKSEAIDKIVAGVRGVENGNNGQSEANELAKEAIRLQKQSLDEARELNRNAEAALNQGQILRGIREVVRKVDDLSRVRH